MTHQHAVVMFTPPRGAEIWYGRCDKAIEAAKATDGILILAGDANGGSDLELFAQRAYDAGLEPARVVKAFNGTDPHWKNTRGDARAAVDVIDILGDVVEVTVVTCWYHIRRAVIALTLELESLGLIELEIREATVDVPNIDVTDEVLANEALGCIDYLEGNPQCSRGTLIGKPEFATG